MTEQERIRLTAKLQAYFPEHPIQPRFSHVYGLTDVTLVFGTSFDFTSENKYVVIAALKDLRNLVNSMIESAKNVRNEDEDICSDSRGPDTNTPVAEGKTVQGEVNEE